jgi:diguanylate cyclase (GGDEF)-like protein/PAS domain S-box-containing protein
VSAVADPTRKLELELVREAFDRTAVGLVVISPEGIFRHVNQAFCDMIGHAREEVEGQSFRRFTHPDDLARDDELLRHIRSGGDMTGPVDKRFLKKGGGEVWVRRVAAVAREPGGQAKLVVGAFFDLTEQRARDRELHNTNAFLSAVVETSPVAIYTTDLEGMVTFWNDAAENIFGFKREQAIGRLAPFISQAKREEAARLRSRVLGGEVLTGLELERQRADGEQIVVNGSAAPLRDQSGTVNGLLVACIDVTGAKHAAAELERHVTRYKEAERALEASEARFRVLTESSLDLISVVDAEGVIRYQSPALKHLLGYESAETVGRNVSEFVHPEDIDHSRAALRRIIEARQSIEPVEFRLRHRDGSWRTFESLGTNRLDNPHIHGVVFNSRDVTDRKVIQQRIQHLAYHDNLTGLPNRSLLQDRLAHSIARAERTNRKVAVLFIDLDNFKNINDTLGHDVGDELLRQVAGRLKECVRAEDTIARQGGDEFIVLLDGLDDGRGASLVAQKILNALRKAIVLSGTDQHVSGSVGIALFPEDGRDAQTLMKNADTAMFHGKTQGKNTYQYFTAQMNVAVKRRMTLESALRRAVMRRDFLLHYQPQIDLDSGEILAVEALVRWKTEDGGMVSPGDFIPLAEETGLINEIGEWVLREACRQAREWQEMGLPRRRMAVNLSARQFADRTFLDMVTRVLAETGLEADCLELEITESQVMRQTEGMIMLLNKLSEMGVQLAIDDFGTGYSSLSYLKRLPIQKLKIDQSFVRDITVDPNDTAIVVAIINMAKSLDLDTIAEGVETAGQLALLRSKGCHVGQGYYFSAPVRAEVLYPLLKQNNLYMK